METNIEIAIRLAAFIGVFLLIAFFELRSPRRTLRLTKWVRWINNLTLVVTSTLLLRLLFPAAAVGIAAAAEEQSWGILNQWQPGFGISVLISVVALDLVIYFQHVLFHSVPLLWRLHMVHHADLDFDVTTGIRFHPVEILLSMLIKAAAILVLGPPVVAVILFEILLNATSMFTHANFSLPARADRLIRLLVVTPDMHRVHHSNIKRETNSNYGFNLSTWDRLFGTYRDQPAAGHVGMTIGLNAYQQQKQQNILWLLTLPFFGKVNEYPINRDANDDN